MAFNHVRGIRAARVRRLKESFTTLHDARHARRRELLAAGLHERSRESLWEERQRADPEALLAALDRVRAAEHRQARRLLPESPTEARLLQILGRDPLHVDVICLRAELPIAEVSSALAMMELKGRVRHVGGMQYVIRF